VTLDPVHLDGIADLARRIRHDVDEADHRDQAELVWEEYLDPLYEGDGVALEPLDGQRRYRAPLARLGLQDDPFPTVHGLDSGTINPRTFRNGLVLDVAQAAMAATPSDLDLHRGRTIIKSVHSNDATVDIDSEWVALDGGYGRARVVHLEHLSRDQEPVVHGLSLYLAESHHARSNAGVVGDLLLLDGPVYPKQLMQWAEHYRGLRDLVTAEPLVEEVLENYVCLVERFVERGVPLAGFVKNPSSGALVRALRGRAPTPWADDAALFGQILERREGGERVTDELTWTNWFRSRLGADGAFADGDLGVERRLDPADYEVAFFVVYDPREDLAFRVELPGAFARDPDVRERVRDHVLAEVAARQGPPLAISKADSLARIGAAEKASLIEKIGDSFGSSRARSYDEGRWGLFD
jgi:hypothetical protein